MNKNETIQIQFCVKDLIEIFMLYLNMEHRKIKFETNHWSNQKGLGTKDRSSAYTKYFWTSISCIRYGEIHLIFHFKNRTQRNSKPKKSLGRLRGKLCFWLSAMSTRFFNSKTEESSEIRAVDRMKKACLVGSGVFLLIEIHQLNFRNSGSMGVFRKSTPGSCCRVGGTAAPARAKSSAEGWELKHLSPPVKSEPFSPFQCQVTEV